MEFKHVCGEIQKFRDGIQSYRTLEIDGREMSIPETVITPCGGKASLHAASKWSAYYFGDDADVMTTLSDGSTASDIEAFVMGALEEDIENGDIVYMDKDMHMD